MCVVIILFIFPAFPLLKMFHRRRWYENRDLAYFMRVRVCTRYTGCTTDIYKMQYNCVRCVDLNDPFYVILKYLKHIRHH